MAMHDQVHLPNDYVIRAGEVGTEMFFIQQGLCTATIYIQVTLPDPDREKSQRSQRSSGSFKDISGRAKQAMSGSFGKKGGDKGSGLRLVPPPGEPTSPTPAGGGSGMKARGSRASADFEEATIAKRKPPSPKRSFAASKGTQVCAA